MDWLSGKKTYIVVFGGLVAIAVSYLTGEITVADAVISALGVLGIGTLRAGVKKSETTKTEAT